MSHVSTDPAVRNQAADHHSDGLSWDPLTDTMKDGGSSKKDGSNSTSTSNGANGSNNNTDSEDKSETSQYLRFLFGLAKHQSKRALSTPTQAQSPAASSADSYVPHLQHFSIDTQVGAVLLALFLLACLSPTRFRRLLPCHSKPQATGYAALISISS